MRVTRKRVRDEQKNQRDIAISNGSAFQPNALIPMDIIMRYILPFAFDSFQHGFRFMTVCRVVYLFASGKRNGGVEEDIQTLNCKLAHAQICCSHFYLVRTAFYFYSDEFYFKFVHDDQPMFFSLDFS